MTLGVRAMPSKKERVKLEMQVMKYRRLARQVLDVEFVRSANEKIAELEQKLREIDD